MKRSTLIPVLMASGLALTSAVQTATAQAAAPAKPAAAPATAATAPAGPTKIAVIAFQVAVGQTNEFQRSFADLQKKWDPKRQEIKKLSDDIDASTKALQSQGATLSDAERANRAKQIDDKKKQLDRSAEDAQNDFQQEMQDLYAGTASKVYDVLSTYAQQNGYTLVLDVAGQQTPVLYALPSTDITKPVIEAYNVKSGVPAPPQGTPAAPAPAGQAPRPAAPKPTAPPK
ncbi:OmpH family outer membrane protein [Occallatibacter riparius]|uniref:OmpH family outer membrane protein n=1 Tax=Occallatibacter riparius TaxID=1002689 RepID=A0A9J7BRR3_9BACT|nr:OmpH family outer membrane protein [Occallatibacter riparius]UWZ85352.1 OmpH family outer membrane protein [Occallatibacter riparius]